MQLQAGDTLISVSDGVLDLFPTSLEVFDAAAIVARSADSAQQVVEQIARFALARRITDDVTALVVRRDEH